jgi:hypothetical protein
MRVALIENGLVINVILVGASYHPDAGVEAIALPDDAQVGIGSAYANGQFTAPQAPSPEPNWGDFRRNLALLPSYMAVATQMEARMPVPFQFMTTAAAYNPPDLSTVIKIWAAILETGIEVPQESIAEWNAIASAANVTIRYALDGTLGEIEP